MNKECQVFISYSRKDKAIVDQVVADIERETHVRCWMDMHGIEGGTQFEEVIISAINKSEVVLFCMSDNSMQSKWTKDEVRYAKGENKRLVPINISGCQPTGWFKFTFGGTDVIDYANELHRDKLYRNLRDWFPAEQEAARIAKAEAERKARDERRAKEEAERKAKAEAERKAQEEAERIAKQEAELKAKAEAERKAKEEAEKIAKARAEYIAKARDERRAKEEAERKAKAEAERKAQEEAERIAKQEAELKAKAEAERRAKEEAEKIAKDRAEFIAKARDERRAKEEAERKAKAEAERNAQLDAKRKANEKSELLEYEEEQKKELKIGLCIGTAVVLAAVLFTLISKCNSQKDTPVVESPISTIETVGQSHYEASVQTTPAAVEVEEEPIFTVVEQEPQFPGGQKAMMEYISKNLRYPSFAAENGIDGRVILSFVVEKDGSITDIQELRSPAEELTMEARCLVQSMPKWKPGKQDGKPVRVKYLLPITFSLQ